MAWVGLSKEESDARDVRAFYQELRQVSKDYRVREIRAHAEDFQTDVNTSPKLVADRADWVLKGSIGGYGAYLEMRRLIKEKPVYDVALDAVLYAAALDWGTTVEAARRVWKSADRTPKAQILRRLGLKIGQIKKENRASYIHAQKIGFEARRQAVQLLDKYKVTQWNQLPYAEAKDVAAHFLVVSDAWLEAGDKQEARRWAKDAQRADFLSVNRPLRIGVRVPPTRRKNSRDPRYRKPRRRLVKKARRRAR